MKRLDIAFVAMFVLLLGAAGLSIAASRGQKVPPRRDFALFPQQIGEWKGRPLGAFDASTLELLGVTDYVNLAYRRNDKEVTLYVGYYRSQRAGESIHSPKACLPGNGYEVLETSTSLLQVPAAGRTIPINEFRLQRDQDQSFVLYWYETHGRVIASEYSAKALLVWEAMRTGRTDGALVRVTSRGGTEGEKTAAEFAREVFPVLRPYLAD
jgi:EpsI family protein